MGGALVYMGDVLNSLDLKNQHVLWLAVGRTTTPWSNDQAPPNEVLTDTDITEIGGYKKADVVSLAKVDATGPIVFNGVKYSLVSDANAYSEVARFVYVKASLNYDEFPLVTFRQTAVYIDLTPNSGHESDDPIIPGNVADNGILYYYRNHPQRTRDEDIVDVLELVIETQGQNT